MNALKASGANTGEERTLIMRTHWFLESFPNRFILDIPYLEQKYPLHFTLF